MNEKIRDSKWVHNETMKNREDVQINGKNVIKVKKNHKNKNPRKARMKNLVLMKV